MRIVVVIIIMAILAGGVAFGVIKMKKMINAPVSDGADRIGSRSMSTATNTTQSFLPYDEVTPGRMIRIGDNFRCVLKCGSVNYNLLTENERGVLETKFQSLIDSLDYVFAFYVQTREMDNREILHNFENSADRIRESLPKASQYCDMFVRAFRDSMKSAGTGLITKQKYIILCSDDMSSLKTADSKEKEKQAANQLNLRANHVKNSLNSMGIKCDICDQGELLELLKLSFSKDIGGSVDGIVDGSFMSDYVIGNVVDLSDDDQAVIDIGLRSVENQIEMSLSTNKIPEEYRKYYELLLNDVTYLRKRYSGYLSDNDLDDSLKYYHRKKGSISNMKHDEIYKTPVMAEDKEDEFEI